MRWFAGLQEEVPTDVPSPTSPAARAPSGGHCFSCSERLLVVLLVCIVCYPAADLNLQVAESFDYYILLLHI